MQLDTFPTPSAGMAGSPSEPDMARTEAAEINGQRPLAVDLEGGGGGALVGMLHAGFDVAASCDISPLCSEIISWNHRGPDRLVPGAAEVLPVTTDLHEADPLTLMTEWGVRPEEVRWIHASPPCQDHSYKGFRRRSGRGHDLLLVPLKWAQSCPNAYITVENVRGVQDSRRFKELLLGLREMGRETCVYEVNAAWYGVPQHRRRVWLVSAPPGLPCPAVPAPTCDPMRPRTWAWAMTSPRPIEEVDDNRFLRGTPWHRCLLPRIPPEGTSADITDPETRSWLLLRYADRLLKFIKRLQVRRPVPCVLTSPLINRLLTHCHPFLNRASTVREMARFQAFPDAYIFPPNIHDAYRIIGEAVPPPMAEAFGLEILRAMGEPGGASRPCMASDHDAASQVTVPPQGYSIICGDAASVLRRMPSGCAQCVITSPPYYGLRDYGVAGQIGNEPSPEEYFRRVRDVFVELLRVVVPDGVLWIVVGETYRNGSPLRLSDRLIDELVESGWIFVSRNIWSKPNPVPQGVRNRPVLSHEYILQFARQRRFRCDFHPLRQPAVTKPHSHGRGRHQWIEGSATQRAASEEPERVWAKDGLRAFRSVWTITNRRCPVPHVAPFPAELAVPPILSSSAPGELVLDPFMGSGTVGVVTLRHGRRFCGIDLNAQNCEMAQQRIQSSLLATAAGATDQPCDTPRRPASSVEWYTPASIFRALGLKFDLDPASPGETIVPWIPVARCLTRKEDGLAQEWSGRVWLNPPFGRGVGEWVQRFADHHNGVMLLPSNTETQWFHQHVLRCDALLFVKRRISFVPGNGNGKAGSPDFGCLLVACGSRCVEALRHCGLGLFVDLKGGGTASGLDLRGRSGRGGAA